MRIYCSGTMPGRSAAAGQWAIVMEVTRTNVNSDPVYGRGYVVAFLSWRRGRILSKEDWRNTRGQRPSQA